MSAFLLIASLILFAYCFFSLIFPLPIRWQKKAFFGILLFIVSMKFLRYRLFGGDFFLSEFPSVCLLCISEALFNTLIFLIFLLFIRDILWIIFNLLKRIGIKFTFNFSGMKLAIFLFSLSLSVGIYGMYEALRVPDVHTVNLEIKNLPNEMDGFSLIQLSDLHVHALARVFWLKEVVRKVNALHPDAICITGDFIDGLPHNIAPYLNPLKELKSKYGVFGITGNHEYYYGAEEWTAELKKLGINMLANEFKTLSENFSIIGLPDLSAKKFNLEEPDLSKAIKGCPEGIRILMVHQPRESENIGDYGITLQISGHTHGGQILPLKRLIAKYNKGFVSGLYELKNSLLYVSPGTGVWHGLFFRLGVSSEITNIVLHRVD